MSTFSAYAASKNECKAEAYAEAAKEYAKSNPESAFSLRTKYKPVVEGKIVYHMVEIIDRETSQATMLTVTVDRNSCSVTSID